MYFIRFYITATHQYKYLSTGSTRIIDIRRDFQKKKNALNTFITIEGCEQKYSIEKGEEKNDFFSFILTQATISTTAEQKKTAKSEEELCIVIEQGIEHWCVFFLQRTHYTAKKEKKQTF